VNPVAQLTAWAHASSPTEFWLWTAGLASASAVLFWFAFRQLRRGRLVEDTPTSLLRSAAQGFVELRGMTGQFGQAPVLAPLTGMPCVWWRYRVEKRSRDLGRSNSYGWHTLAHGTSEELFLLNDGTGECIVDPTGADIVGAERVRWYGSTERPPHGSAPRARQGLLSLAFAGTGRYRYTEERIYNGDRIYGLGWYHTRDGSPGPGDMRRDLSELLRTWKRDRESLLERFDADGDGRIDAGEWEQARQAAVDELRRRRRKTLAAGPVDLFGKPPDGRPFLLSTRSQKQLSGIYRWTSAASLAGFLLAGAASVWLTGLRLAGG